MSTEDAPLQFEMKEDYTEALKFAGPKMRQMIANEINKGLRDGRSSVVSFLLTRTRMPKDRIGKVDARGDQRGGVGLGRANPDDLTGFVWPLFAGNKFRIYMDNSYPFSRTISRGKPKVRLDSPIYRRNMRTGYISKFRGREMMFMVTESGRTVRVLGRTVPGLFKSENVQQKFSPKIFQNVYSRLDDLILGTIK